MQVLISFNELDFLVEDSDVSLLNSDLVVDRLTSRSVEVLSGADGLSSLELDNGNLGDSLSGDIVSLGEDLDLMTINLDNSGPSLDSVGSAWAWLSSDDHLSSLLADSESLLNLDDVGSLVLHLSLVSLDSDGLGSSLDLESPSLDLSFVASAALLGALNGDGDWLAGSLASDDSVSVNSDLVLDDDLSSLFSGLDESESDLLAVARLVSDDDLSGLLAGLQLVSEDDNSLLDLRLLLSSDGDSDLLGDLDLSSPSLDSGSAASAWLLDVVNGDDDLAGSLAPSDSVSIKSNFLFSNQYLLLSGLNLDFSLQSLATTSLDWGRLHDNFTSLVASSLVELLGLDELSVRLSDSGSFNSVNS